MKRLDDLAQRRALLISRCELDRLELALAWHDVRRSLRITGDGDESAPRPWASRAMGLVAPILGVTRVRRMSRYVSMGLLAWRVATGLRKRR